MGAGSIFYKKVLASASVIFATRRQRMCRYIRVFRLKNLLWPGLVEFSRGYWCVRVGLV